MTTTPRRPRRPELLRKVTATLAVLGAVAGLELFVAVGPFDSAHDPFPQLVVTAR